MSTRIRYNKTNTDGVLETDSFVVGTKQLKVTLSTHLHPFVAEVMTYEDGKEIGHNIIEHKSLPTLKKLVKDELKAQGVAFQFEVRPRLNKETLQKALEHMRNYNNRNGV